MKLFVPFIAIAALFSSCKERAGNSSSEAKNGPLKTLRSLQGNHMINIPPSEPIHVCGAHADLGVKAVKAWAGVIGREKLNVVESCEDTLHKWTIRDVGSERSISECASEGIRTAFMRIYTREVMLCNQVSASNLYSRILHEFGHAWGLCDQVRAWHGTASDLCDPEFAESIVENSVMGGSAMGYSVPQPDDIRGMKNLAARFPAGWDNEPVTQPSQPVNPNLSILGEGVYSTLRSGVDGCDLEVGISTQGISDNYLLLLKCTSSNWTARFKCLANDTSRPQMTFCEYHDLNEDERNNLITVVDRETFIFHGAKTYNYKLKN